MYSDPLYYVRVKRRTTIEIDASLLSRAQQALGSTTTRATVEEALRRPKWWKVSMLSAGRGKSATWSDSTIARTFEC